MLLTATETQITRQKYNKNSRYYDSMELFAEEIWFRQWRKELLKKVKGPRILEIGVGTGKNLKYYPEGHRIIGIDLSEKMMTKAIPLAKEKNTQLIQMDAEHLAFPDATFDTVVVTFVFCSVPNLRFLNIL